MAVVADEVDWPEGSVLICFAHHAPDTAFSKRDRSLSIEREHQQTPVRSHVETHALMHHGGVAGGQIVYREDDGGLAPITAIRRSQKQRASRRNMFAQRVAEIFQVELSVPVCEHWRVIIGPAERFWKIGMLAVGAKDLAVFHSDRRTQLSF